MATPTEQELAARAQRLPTSALIGEMDVNTTRWPDSVRLAAAARAEIDRRLPIPSTVEGEPRRGQLNEEPWHRWAARWEELCGALNLGALPSHEQALARVQAMAAREAKAEELIAALDMDGAPTYENALARAKELVALEAEDEEQPRPEADRALLTTRALAEILGCSDPDRGVIARVKALRDAADTLIAERDEARAEVARLRGEAAGLRVEMNVVTSERDASINEVERLRIEAAKAKATAEQMFDRWAALCDVLGYGRAFRHEARAGLPTVEDVHRAALARLREWSGAERAEVPLWQELCHALGVTGPGALDASNREAAHNEALSEIRGLCQLERDVEEERDRPFWTRPR